MKNLKTSLVVKMTRSIVDILTDIKKEAFKNENFLTSASYTYLRIMLNCNSVELKNHIPLFMLVSKKVWKGSTANQLRGELFSYYKNIAESN